MTASATRSDRVCPPESAVIRAPDRISSPVNSFARAIVRPTMLSSSILRDRTCIARNSSTVRSARHRVFWVIRATGLCAGSRTNSSGGYSPLTRTVRPVAVSLRAKTSISLMKALFPGAGGADDRYRVARVDDDRVEPLRFRPGRIVISRMAEGSMLEGRHAGR